MQSVMILMTAFTAVVSLLIKTKNAALSLLIGSGILAIFSGMAFEIFFQTLLSTLLAPRTLKLIVGVVCLSILARLMSDSNMMLNMVGFLQKLIRNQRITLGLIPAIIGLLPVFGGAHMSAPLVKEASQKFEVDSSRMVAVNLIFRHLVYFIFPLYPSLIMVQDMTGISLYTIIKYNFLPFLMMLIGSYFVILKPMQINSHVSCSKEHVGFKDAALLLYYVSPILLVVALTIVMDNLVVAALASILWVLFLNTHNEISKLYSYIRNSIIPAINWELALIIYGALLFQNFVIKIGAVEQIALYFDKWQIPLILVALILPFLVGMMTGATIGALGITIPIFLPFIGLDSGALLVSIIFMMTLCGYLISPLHICFILSQQYFGGDLKRIYVLASIPMLLLIMSTLVLWWAQ